MTKNHSEEKRQLNADIDVQNTIFDNCKNKLEVLQKEKAKVREKIDINVLKSENVTIIKD